MGRKFLIFAMFFVFMPAIASAQSSGIGVGVKLGEPTALTAKYWLNNNNAISGSLGYSMLSNKNIYISVDYLYHSYGVVKTPQEDFPLFYGFGLRISAKEHNDGSLGIRGIGGIAWHANEIPLEIFVEMAPVFRLLPSTGLDLEAAIGGRIYF